MKKLMLAVLFVLLSVVSSQAAVIDALVYSTAEDDNGVWYLAKVNDDPKSTAGQAIGRADILMSHIEARALMTPFDSAINLVVKMGVKKLKPGKYLVAQYVGSTGAMVFYNATSNGVYIEVVGEPIDIDPRYWDIQINSEVTNMNTEMIKLGMR